MSDSERAERRLIRAADPAAAVRPFRPDELRRLADTARDDAGRAPRRRPRPTRRGWLVGAVAAAGATAALAVALPLALAPGSGAEPTALTQAPGADGLATMCAPVSAEAIAQSDVAVLATVRSIDAGTVTLEVDQTWRGDVARDVTVPQGDGEPVDGGPLAFEPGRSYLLASRDGVLLSCGASGPDSPELEILYRAAFE